MGEFDEQAVLGGIWHKRREGVLCGKEKEKKEKEIPWHGVKAKNNHPLHLRRL